MFPKKMFYKYHKLAFLAPLYQTLYSVLNESNDDSCFRPFSKEVEFLNENVWLVKIKSIHEPSSLNQALFFIKLIKSCSFEKVISIGSVGFKLKSSSVTLLS